jgi:hypothetical protein
MLVRVLHIARDIDLVLGKDQQAAPPLFESPPSESLARLPVEHGRSDVVQIADIDFRFTARKEL